MSRRLLVFFATGAYLGFVPVASGTFGTLAGVALYPAFDALRERSLGLYLVTFCGLVAAAIVIAGEAEALFGEKDSGKITIDEVAGYIAATLFLRPSLGVIAGELPAVPSLRCRQALAGELLRSRGARRPGSRARRRDLGPLRQPRAARTRVARRRHVVTPAPRARYLPKIEPRPRR